MINRETHTVQVVTYSDTPDQYGQKHTTVASTVTIEASINILSQTNVENPKYIDADALMLTKYTGLTDKNDIIDGSTKYKIKHILPAYTNRGYTQVYLRNDKS